MKKGTLSRIKEYLDFKGVSNRAFEKQFGFSNGSFASQLKNDKTIGVDRLENILREYTDIDVEWLLTGRGSMLRDERPAQPVQAAAPTIIYKSDPKDLKIIALQEDKIKTLEEKIKILEEKPSSQPQVLATSRSVDTITITGTQSTHK